MDRIYRLYLELEKKHGSPECLWPQWCSSKKSPRLREVIAIGAILTQRTSWHNADLALANLADAEMLSLEVIAGLHDLDRLARLIKPAGFYRTKSERIRRLSRFIIDNYGSLEKFAREELPKAREELLSLNGIGPETADTILLYALDRPTFVVDEYTRRLVEKRGLAKKLNYDHLKDLFESGLPRDPNLYQDFHALIIIEGKGKKGSAMAVR